MNRKPLFAYTLIYVTSLLLVQINLFAQSDNKIPKYKPDPSKWTSKEINIAWIGHATVLINFYGKIILTDPALFPQVGIPLMNYKIGPTRAVNPALDISEIPKPDMVLISHAHMDHMDYETLNALTKKFPAQIDCITAANTKDVIEDLNWRSLSEIDWNESISIDSVKIIGIEVIHNGWRYPGEKDRSNGDINGRSYNGYIIERNHKKIFFAGDTAYDEKFGDLKKENIDIVIMPIGGYVPKYYYHCNPEEAFKMADELIGAQYFIPIHANTFEEKSELDKPLIWMEEIKNNYRIKVVIEEIGQTFTLK